MSAARSLDAAMKRIDEIRERQAWAITSTDIQRMRTAVQPGMLYDVEVTFGPEGKRLWIDGRMLCACEPDESCQECDAA